MRKEIFIDLETTGLDSKKDRILQIAGIVKIDGKIKEKFNFKSKKSVFLKNLCDVLDKHIDPYNKNDKAYLVGWNSKFDSDFLHQAFKLYSKSSFGNYMHHMSIDIQQLCAYKFMKKGIVPRSFKLEDIARYFKIPCSSKKFHDAMYDINITNEIYKKLLKL